MVHLNLVIMIFTEIWNRNQKKAKIEKDERRQSGLYKVSTNPSDKKSQREVETINVKKLTL